jgi:hypothetical protein
MADKYRTTGSDGAVERFVDQGAGTGTNYWTRVMQTFLGAGSALIGKVDVHTAVAPAEVVVAGAASTLGKIGTIAAGATLFVRIPCATTAPATSRALWRVSANKAHTITKYRARTVVNAPTITLASVQANDTVIINGLTFTAHADTTVEATGQFKIDGATDTLDADELVKCINTRFAALGLTADAPAAVITLTATTATVTQCVTGVGGARIVCAQTLPLGLDLDVQGMDGNPIVDATATGTAAHNGKLIEQSCDGYPHLYLSVKNDSGDALTLVVGSTLLSF